MKNLTFILITFLTISFTSCVVIDNTPGPNGRDGNAYFGIDYEHEPPYSYWDNNKSIPYDPTLGDYYYTAPGIYDFEYFINEYDYWYGTYEIWVNVGGIGGPHGEPGYDGLDSYLMLITDPNGFHEHRESWKMENDMANNEALVIEKHIGEFNYKITIQKANTLNRSANEAKYVRSK